MGLNDTPNEPSQTRQMSLHRHRQRMIIVCLPPRLTDSQCRSFLLNFYPLAKLPITKYVNGIVGIDTRRLRQLGPFVVVRHNRDENVVTFRALLVMTYKPKYFFLIMNKKDMYK